MAAVKTMRTWELLREVYGSKEPAPRIKKMAYIAGGGTAIILSPSGTDIWGCVPDMAAPSIFAKALGGIGHWELGPIGIVLSVKREYLPESLVLKTTYETTTGTIVVIDCLVWAPAEEEGGKLIRKEQRGMLIRRVKCTKGRVQIRSRCVPVFAYDADIRNWHPSEHDPEHRGYAMRKGLELELSSNKKLRFTGPVCASSPTLVEGDVAYYALDWGEASAPNSLKEVDKLIKLTIKGSQDWLSRGNIDKLCDGLPASRASRLKHHALVLRGLINYHTGAIAAAATTSFPETLEKGKGKDFRTWDYRFTWVRDGTMVAITLLRLGYREEAEAFLAFILRQPDLREKLLIMYGIGGQIRAMKERVHKFLRGWRGLGPVRIGNDAYKQQQLDLWGWILLLAHLLWKDRPANEQMEQEPWRTLFHLTEKADEAWGRKDKGMWESRGPDLRFTSTNGLLAIALACGSHLARRRARRFSVYGLYAERWARKYHEYREWILRETVDSERGFRIAQGQPESDISVLLLPLLGIVEHSDPAVLNTIAAIRTDLCVEGSGLPVRYPQSFNDGMGHTKEGAWFLGAFWLAAVMHLAGNHQEAENVFAEATSHGGELELFAEQVDPETGEHLGNFPQAFSHLTLIWVELARILGESPIAVEQPDPGKGEISSPGNGPTGTDNLRP